MSGSGNGTSDLAQQAVARLTAADQAAGQMTDEQGNPVEGAAAPKRVDREPPTPPEPRRKLLDTWIARVKADKKHHEKAFKLMR